jgi:DNA-binding response OmpR family regulator
LKKEGFETIEAYDGEQGLELALNQKPDLILLDIMFLKWMALLFAVRSGRLFLRRF